MQKTKDLICPSGLAVTIRETTGADDDVFSGSSSKDYETINTFISGIIVGGDLGAHVSASKILEMLLRDKYFILLSSRIFSLSPILYFTHTWMDGVAPSEYDVDLQEYIWDYTTPFPTPDSPDYFDQRIPPYPEGTDGWVYFTLGEQEARFHYLDGKGEAYLLNLPASKRSINQQFTARELQVKQRDTWEAVKNFAFFSARDMVVLRSKLAEADPEIQGLVIVSNPYTGEEVPMSILGIVDFFFPTRI